MPSPKGHPPYNTEGQGGRPKKYTKEFIEQKAEEFKKWLKDPSNIWIKDFAIEHEFSTRLLSMWAAENERFSEVYELAKQIQESRLSKGAILKNYDSSFTKFILVNHHDYKDKSESKISGDSENPFMVMFEQINGKTKDLVNE